MRRPHRPERSGLAVKLLVAAAAAGVVWVFGLFQFAGWIPARVADTQTQTDAIVVLTGGSRRLGKGLDLLSQGLSDTLFVSGVYRGVDVQKLLKIVKRKPEELESRISIGVATNTAGNATETRDWMASRQFRSLRLVTAAYHMPRSLLEFRFAMPGATIVSHPVFPDNVKQARWWAWPGTASLVISEYNKLLFAWVRHGLGRLAEMSGLRAPIGTQAGTTGGAR
ncbi:MAG: YdcF family protein [Rhodospirillales bacterium]|nr:YdcF family protein [Alphaproteobacteria bacterium]MBL6948060.1 YdcF family protein [Rhodospirillales bacterium]